MASVWKKGKKEQTKASGLDAVSVPEWDKAYHGGTMATEERPVVEKSHRRTVKQGGKEWITASRLSAQRLAWVSDLLVLLLIALIVVGCVFGYRALKQNAVEPDIKTVWIKYEVVLYEVPQETDLLQWLQQPFGLVSLTEDRALDRALGTVEAAEWDEVVPRMVRVTVNTAAKYEEGKGYRVDDLRLMAGVTPTEARFQIGDVVSTGMIAALAAN